jgi:hypothetical protein
MNEVRVKTDDWRAIAQALTGEDAWTYGATTEGYQDYTHGIPQTRWERREYTLGDHAVTEVSFYALRMVGNGHMLESLRSMEVELRMPEVVRVARVEGREGLFVASEEVDVRGRLGGAKASLERRPQAPAEDVIRVNRILAGEGAGSDPDPAAAPPPTPGVGFSYVCRYGHVNDEAERDPINDAFFCVECGVEIE